MGFRVSLGECTILRLEGGPKALSGGVYGPMEEKGSAGSVGLQETSGSNFRPTAVVYLPKGH